MRKILHFLLQNLCICLCLFSPSLRADKLVKVPILTYHNFDPVTPGSMSILTAKFEKQLKWLKDNNYTVIPLRDLVDYLKNKKSSLPEKSVVITADDGRKSVYTYMLPIVRKYKIPVTLFVYPSSISNAAYAMTWQQLKELQKTGLFDIQGHTYWHPNFKTEKKRLSAKEYEKFVNVQLVNAKKTLDQKLDTNINLLAWPFGIYDEYLEQAAKNAGYEMAFSIDNRAASKAERVMAQPRYLILDGQDMRTFAKILQQ